MSGHQTFSFMIYMDALGVLVESGGGCQVRVQSFEKSQPILLHKGYIEYGR